MEKLHRSIAAMAAILTFSAAQAEPITHRIYFDQPELSGAFSYDSVDRKFSSFIVSWTRSAIIQDPYTNDPHPLHITQTDTFNLTEAANSPLIYNIQDTTSVALGLSHTPDDTFGMISNSWVLNPPYAGSGYEMNIVRNPGLGSQEGEGRIHFTARVSTYEVLQLSSYQSFTTTTYPYQTSDPNLMLSGSIATEWALSPFPTNIPEPATLVLVIVALLGVIAARRCRSLAPIN